MKILLFIAATSEKAMYLLGLGGVQGREIFEKNGAIWDILKCNLEGSNVMKIKNVICKNILFIIIMTHNND